MSAPVAIVGAGPVGQIGDILVRESGKCGFGRRQSLGQIDIPVDRVADEVDRGERVAAFGHQP